MSLFSWFSRRAGGLSMVALIALSYWVISQESTLQRHAYKHEQPGEAAASYSSTSTTGAGIWTYIFAYYSLLVHALMFFFPIRSCWAVWDLTQALRRTSRHQALEDYKKLAPGRRRGSQTSLSSSETLMSEANAISSTTSESGDLEFEMYTDGGKGSRENTIHAIVIPNYKEDLDTLKETLDVLASHPNASSSYDVYLGMEQRELSAESKALGLIESYVKRFRSMDYTLHPSDIPGESAGKGSNMGWAARKLSAQYPVDIRRDVIVTGIDSDSHLSSTYFIQLNNMHLSYPDTALTTLYAAPIIFDRNAGNVPALVRVADIMWAGCGMSGLYRGSSIAPPTSVYSMPLVLIDQVGGWDCDADAIGEDLHMYLKSFFALNGNLTCRTIMSPVSQCNVTSGRGQGIRAMIADIAARYNQALRHMWGALDSGYAMRKGVELWQERKHTTRAFRPLHQTPSGDSPNIYVPQTQIAGGDVVMSSESGIFSDVTQETIKEPHWENIFYLCHRIYEAHFLPVHMTILVIASTLYVLLAESKDDPYNLAWTFRLANVLRTAGFTLASCYLFLYESYHRLAANAREREMKEAGLSGGMSFSHRSAKKNWLDYLLVPVVAPLYGAIPSAHALIAQLWTRDLVYTVSKKATRQRARSLVGADMA